MIFTLPVRVTTTVSGLRRRWNRPSACMGARASASSRTIWADWRAVTGPWASSERSVMPVANSVTMKGWSPSMASRTRTKRESTATAARRAASRARAVSGEWGLNRCTTTRRDRVRSIARQVTPASHWLSWASS
ncbi:hypothetical protein MAJHIDBO_01313 [Propionibacterium freudenreichii subsp. shermanii]|nr:hypothetical protein MAJHIDBO_01313 [Propionibacterium freudenreichii subsp. shermanii]SPS09108.1 hypothetical protein MAJHIDBO_01313 [Propionibacterium freudenreichii subsp. shermanii]